MDQIALALLLARDAGIEEITSALPDAPVVPGASRYDGSIRGWRAPRRPGRQT